MSDRIRELVGAIVVDRGGSVALRPVTRELRAFLVNSRLGSSRGEGARWLHGFGIALDADGNYEVCERQAWSRPVTSSPLLAGRDAARRVVATLVLPFVARERRAGVMWEFAGLEVAPRTASLPEAVSFSAGFATRLEALQAAHEFLACGVRRAVGPYVSRFRPTARDVVDELWAAVPEGAFSSSEMAFNHYALRNERRNPWPMLTIGCTPGPSRYDLLLRDTERVLDVSSAQGRFDLPCRPDDAIVALAMVCCSRIERYAGRPEHAAYDVSQCVEGHQGSRLFSHPELIHDSL